MSDSGKYEVIHEGGSPIKAWVKGVQLEDAARQQLVNVAALPFIHKHVAAMPDVHWGIGATIGSVIPTRGAIIPAAVGVDIGCGMMAVQTTLRADQLPDNLQGVRIGIEIAVPHGRTDNGGKNDRGAWGEVSDRIAAIWDGDMGFNYGIIIEKHPKAKAFNTARHMGTLGTGNHFIEVCLDESDRVWVMLHSGSRGCGNRIGTYFIQAAKKEMERWFVNLPDKDLAYLVEGSELFDDYIEAVGWAQEFARRNRKVMMDATLEALRNTLPKFTVTDMAINCHHNYVARENHFGAKVWLTRKGAIRAREGDLGIIPGSMGVRSYIVRGKGDAESFHSCSHGAGRAMSRGQAKKQFSLQDHAKATEGVECRKDAGVIDETPGAYKDINAVMAAQTDLVEVVHTLKQVVCVKG
ncbi:MAG: RNA-splicing ligase RtcB [Rhodospirillaceae bacterium]|jgi:tRNA-splicing ligase RtcB|nr:RNA-splicing ligase RtcB [Rhodospirillaceae bacterium]|tara:strand:+ start:3981 stop:5207 length:1227 start_codon:yes stop_codon:yes gene_type:complete